jgi:hypothetical protein
VGKNTWRRRPSRVLLLIDLAFRADFGSNHPYE